MPPQDPKRLLQTALQFAHAGQLPQAETALRAALALAPGQIEILGHLAKILQQQAKLSEALALADRALALAPNLPALHFLRGNILLDLQRFPDAVTALEQTIRLAPSFTDGRIALGFAQLQSANPRAAEEAWRRAVALSPNSPAVHSNLAALLLQQDRAEESLAHSRRAVELAPRLAAAHAALANTLVRLGRMDEAIATYRRGVDVDPADRRLISGLVFALHFRQADAAVLRPPHAAWAKTQPPPDAAPFPNTRDPHRRLRIGYLSPDFRAHALTNFFEPLLAHHNRAAFEIYCYAQVTNPDAITARLRSQSDHWHSTVGLSDTQVAGQIRTDQIDILVDLALHTTGNRLDVMAQPPPVQASYLGYPSTTGLAAVDYVLLDPHLATPAAAALCVEKILPLVGPYFCFRPPVDVPLNSDLPASRSGHITFGSFNSFAKISPEALALWARVLAAVPSSRLLVQSSAMRDPAARSFILTALASDGITADRITLRPSAPLVEYLGQISEIDIALDAFPYNGGTTTCHALWMGAPVITLAGQLPTGRMGLSILTTIGLPELVAHTPAAFIQIATALANDLPRLSALRSTMRARTSASPLMDEPAAARALESAYRQMWQNYCSPPNPST